MNKKIFILAIMMIVSVGFVFATSYTEGPNVDLTSTDLQTACQGIQVHVLASVSSDIMLRSVTLDSTSDASYVYIWNGTHNSLDTRIHKVSVVNHVATLPYVEDLKYSGDEYFFITAGNDDANFNRAYQGTSSYPFTDTVSEAISYIHLAGGCYSTAGATTPTTYIMNVLSYTFEDYDANNLFGTQYTNFTVVKQNTTHYNYSVTINNYNGINKYGWSFYNETNSSWKNVTYVNISANEWSSANVSFLYPDLSSEFPDGIIYRWWAEDVYGYYSESANQTQTYNAPPTISEVYVIPSIANGDGFEPITTTDMDCKFTPADADEDSINASITWYKNSSSVVSQVGTYNYSWVDVTRNASTQTSSGQGRTTEALSKDDMWWCEITATDGTSITTQISNKITVVNNPPTIDTVEVINSDLSTNSNSAKEDKGGTITFEVTGNDAEEDNVELRICETNSTWAGCTVLCEQTTPVGFQEIVDHTISCTFDTSSITTTNNTYWAVLRDSPSNDEITVGGYNYYVNQPIVYTDISHKDTTGDTTYYFGESLDYVAVILDDPEDADSSMSPYYTVYDPESTVVVNNVLMNHQIGTTYWNQNDVFLNAVGEWLINVCTTDSDGWQICYNETFNVSIVTKSTDTSIYGWDYGNISTNESVDSDMTDYAYSYIELEINGSATAQDWSDVKERINKVKDNSGLAILTMRDDLQSTTAETFIASNYADLISYATGLFMLEIEVPVGTPVNSTNDLQATNTAKEILQQTNNLFPVRLKNYDSAGVNSNYATPTNIVYIDAPTATDLINAEASRMRDANKNRMYEGATDKVIALNIHNNIVSKQRSTLVTSSYAETNVAELNNKDIIVFNNDTSPQSFLITVNDTVIGRDVYDYTSHSIVEMDNDGIINITIGATTGSVVYFEDLSKIEIQSDDENLLYSSTLGDIETKESYEGTTQNSWGYTESSTNNHYDGMIILNDPNYNHMNFYSYYGDLREVGVDNMSIYDTVIFADKAEDTCGSFIADCSTYDGAGNFASCVGSYSNQTDGENRACVMPNQWGDGLCVERTADLGSAISGNTGICSDNIYDDDGSITQVILNAGVDPHGYMAIDDYCNPSTWTETDRQTWIAEKKTEMDRWANVDTRVNFFLDGYDIGDSATCDNATIENLFVDSVKDIADYGRITLGRKIIFNTYTQYQDVVHMADGIMKESCVRRWNGTTDNPTYSWEDWNIELARYNYFSSFGIDVYCQGFAEQNDYESAYYIFLAGKILGYDYISVNQPKFWYAWYNGFDDNWNHFKFPAVGASLDGDLTDEGSGIYSRRFENGLIRIDTNTHTGEFISDQVISNMELCAWLRDGSDTKEGVTFFTFNDNFTNKQTYLDDAHPADASYYEKCVTLDPDTFYEPSGYYNLKFFYGCPPLGPLGSCQAMVQSRIRTSLNNSIVGGRRSALDDGSAGNEDHTNSSGGGFQPDLDESTYLAHDTGWTVSFDTRSTQLSLPKWYNFDVSLKIDRTASKLVDTIPTSTIVRTESGAEKKFVEFASAYDYDINVYDKLVFFNRSVFNGIYAGDTELDYYESSACVSSQPLYNKTLVDGYNWSACYWNPAGDGYYVRIALPNLLNEQNYTVDGNLLPNVTSQVMVLVGLENGSQQWDGIFNVVEPDGNAINICGVEVDGVLTAGTYNTTTGNCSVSFASYLNASYPEYLPRVSDSYDDFANGTVEQGITYLYSNLLSNYDKTSNDSVQYVYEVYNFTNPQAENYSNMLWTRNSTDENTTITIEPSTLTQGQKELALDLVTLGTYGFVPDAGDFYFVDEGETVFRTVTMTWVDEATYGTLPPIELNYYTTRWATGSDSVTLVGTGAQDYAGGATMKWNTTATGDASLVYNVTHQATIVYSDNDTLTSTDIAGVRTWNWNNGTGKTINFMFSSLIDPANTIFDNINSTLLTDWADRIALTQTLTDELGNNVSYNYNDNTVLDRVEIDFSPVSGDNLYLLDLEWDAYYTITQCNDNSDNDGDGDIDEADTGCHTDLNASNSASYNALDTSETVCGDSHVDSGETCDDGNTVAGDGCSATCIIETSGGGGGGSSTSTTTVLGKTLCDITITPSAGIITDTNPLQKFTVINRESVSYTPEIKFQDIVGQNSVIDNIELSNDIGTVLKGTQKEFGAQYRGGIFGSVAVDGATNMVFTSDKCLDIVIPISVDITASNVVADLLQGSDPLTDRIGNLINVPITEKATWAKVWILLGLVGILFGLFFFNPSIKWSENEVINWSMKILAWLMIVGFATAMLVMIVRGLLGS